MILKRMRNKISTEINTKQFQNVKDKRSANATFTLKIENALCKNQFKAKTKTIKQKQIK